MERGTGPQDQIEIEKQITEKGTPDFTGEGGYLHTVKLPEKTDKTLWAKRWHLSNPFRVKLHEELDGQLVSPYFHELRRIEYELIHDAFPDITVQMYGSYDPRISEDRKNFRFFPGYATTVTVEAKGDDKLVKEYRGVIDDWYILLHQSKAKLKEKGEPSAAQIDELGDELLKVHEIIYTLLGPDISLPKIGLEPDALDVVANRLNPANAMFKLLKAGIIPIHPEVNFVPGTRDTHPDPPHGTFIELMIRDTKKLETAMSIKLVGNDEDLRSFKQKLNYFSVLQRLNKLYSYLLPTTVKIKGSRVKFIGLFDPVFLEAVFCCTEKLRVLLIEGRITIEMFDHLLTEIPIDIRYLAEEEPENINFIVNGFTSNFKANLDKVLRSGKF